MRRLLAIVAIGMIIAGCWHGYFVFLEYQAGQELYEDITDQFTVCRNESVENADENQDTDEQAERRPGTAITIADEESEQELYPDDAPAQIEVDWKGLKEINGDVVAWIQLPAIDISYPIVQGEDNNYYLHRSIEGKEIFSGCLFMDVYNDPELQNFNTIIYGHNMRDGSMFARLKEYDQSETWKTCPYFWLYTEEGEYLYRIFSSHRTAVNGSTFTVRFADKEYYIDWLQKMKDRSNVKSDVELVYGDKVVTLSTCTSGSETRQILQGVLVYQSFE